MQKKYLSNKSDNEEERKKTRDSGSDSSLNKETNDDTDQFTEGLESPRYASILYDCFKNFGQKFVKLTNFFPL